MLVWRTGACSHDGLGAEALLRRVWPLLVAPFACSQPVSLDNIRTPDLSSLAPYSPSLLTKLFVFSPKAPTDGS